MKSLLIEYRLRKLENKYNEARQVGDIYHVAGYQVLENLSTVIDGVVKCTAGMDRAISRMNRLL